MVSGDTTRQHDDDLGLVSRFDHHAPQFAREGVPERVYAELRARKPVAHTDAHGGFWVLSRYADIDAVARDTATFSSALGINIPDPATDPLPEAERRQALASGQGRAIPVMLDPPKHAPIRRLLSQPLSPNAVAEREPLVRRIVDEAIDGFAQTGHCEAVADFCAVVPAIVTLEILGLPSEDWRRWSRFVLQEFGERTDGTPPDLGAAEFQTILATIAERREAPADDLISRLTEFSLDGEHLDDETILNIVSVMIFAGLDTVTNTVASSIVELDRRPELKARLAESDDRTLWTSAVEELLRYTCPVQGFKRTVREDTTIADVDIRRGERVFILYASANRDPEVFERPHEIDLGRTANRHMSFGQGVHRCLGAHLARLECRVMLRQLLSRIPGYTVSEGLELHSDCGLVYGYRRVPLTFSPVTL